jgi:hypothetical protein
MPFCLSPIPLLSQAGCVVCVTLPAKRHAPKGIPIEGSMQARTGHCSLWSCRRGFLGKANIDPVED